MGAAVSTTSAPAPSATAANARYSVHEGFVHAVASGIGSQMPGILSQQAHDFVGANGVPGVDGFWFRLNLPTCATGKVVEDQSIFYWSKLFFRDPVTQALEPVAAYGEAFHDYAAADNLTPYPLGYYMVAGDDQARTPPSADDLKSGKNPTMVCLAPTPDTPGWPLDSDGLHGVGMSINQDPVTGVGFPDVQCQTYTRLRAGLMFPQCFSADGSQFAYHDKADSCAYLGPGWNRGPAIYLEVHYDTGPFDNRWTPGQGASPWVFSNGDVTGYSFHAGFVNGWEPSRYETIMTSCTPDSDYIQDLNTCGAFKDLPPNNDTDCTMPSGIVTPIAESSPSLPGNNSIGSWPGGSPVVKGPSRRRARN